MFQASFAAENISRNIVKERVSKAWITFSFEFKNEVDCRDEFDRRSCLINSSHTCTKGDGIQIETEQDFIQEEAEA